MQETTNKRVRINLSETAKGLIQFDMKEALSKAVDAAREVIKAKGLKEVSA